MRRWPWWELARTSRCYHGALWQQAGDTREAGRDSLSLASVLIARDVLPITPVTVAYQTWGFSCMPGTIQNTAHASLQLFFIAGLQSRYYYCSIFPAEVNEAQRSSNSYDPHN